MYYYSTTYTKICHEAIFIFLSNKFGISKGSISCIFLFCFLSKRNLAVCQSDENGQWDTELLPNGQKWSTVVPPVSSLNVVQSYQMWLFFAINTTMLGYFFGDLQEFWGISHQFANV